MASKQNVVPDPTAEGAPTPLHIMTTRDQALRAKIDDFVGYNLRKYTPPQFNYFLSKILGEVELSETGNAIRFAARYRHRARYVPQNDSWYIFNGHAWLKDEENYHKYLAAETAAYIEMEADLHPEQARREALKKWALKSRNNREIKAMLELAIGEPQITVPYTKFDSQDYLLNTQNGVFDLENVAFLPHDHNLLLSRITNAVYDPDARCPEWDKFLQKATLGRPNIIRFLQQFCGMCLTGVIEKDLFTVFSGTGGNGKTVFLEAIKTLLGSYADVATQYMFLERRTESGDFELADMPGVRFLFKDETKQGAPLDEAFVKATTGGRSLKAVHKFGRHFTFAPKFKIILATNYKPRINGNDDGIWRRIVDVPWHYKFERDPECKPKPEVLASFEREASGILNWCLLGFFDYKQNGVIIPPELHTNTENYRRTSDIMGAFLEEYCIVGNPHDHITKKELYLKYVAFMEENGSHKLNKPNFGEALKQRGFEDKRTGKEGWMWQGIRLREEGEEMQQPASSGSILPITEVAIDG